MKVQDIKSGRVYSWVYEGEYKMLKGGRNGIAPNPFNDLVVTKRVVYAGQAATGESWMKAQLALNPDYTPSGRAPQFLPTEYPCIVKSVSSGELQVRIMNFRKTTKSEIFIDGRLATPAQMEILKAYKPSRSRSENYVPVMFPYLHNLSNVEYDMLVNVPILRQAETVTA